MLHVFCFVILVRVTVIVRELMITQIIIAHFFMLSKSHNHMIIL